VKKILARLYGLLALPVCALGVLLAPLRFVRNKTGNNKPRSLWAGRPIITLSLKARAERTLGICANSLVYSTYYTTCDFDYNLSRFYAVPVFGKLIPFGVFLWACAFTDRLHFYCDRGLIPSPKPFSCNFAELYVYRLLGIQVFFWTYGADVRSRDATRALGEPNCCTECELVGRACICDERSRVQKMERLRKYSNAVFSMGDMIECTPGSRNDLFFWPIDLHASSSAMYRPVYPEVNKAGPLRIVHASNHRMFKGTHFLIEAVEELEAGGVQLELILVEKMPNDRALDIYRSADVIFDQCLIGFHGYFALEGMAMGKPVMCFIRRPKEYLLHPDECPIVHTNIDTLREDIRRLAADREQLRDIGIRSRRYIERNFTIEAFAMRLKKAYRDIGVTV